MTPLLRYHIGTLRLRTDAPFPSEVIDAHDFIRKWRMSQRLHLLQRPDSDVRCRDSDTDDMVDTTEVA